MIHAGKSFNSLSIDAIFAIVQLLLASVIAVNVVSKVKNVDGVTDPCLLGILDMKTIHVRPVKTKGLTEQH